MICFNMNEKMKTENCYCTSLWKYYIAYIFNFRFALGLQKENAK